MTNWKDGPPKGGRGRKKSDKTPGKVPDKTPSKVSDKTSNKVSEKTPGKVSDKAPSEKKWKKVKNVHQTVTAVKEKIDEINERKQKGDAAPASPAPQAEPAEATSETKEPEVTEPKPKESGSEQTVTKTQAQKIKEEVQAEDEDPKVVIRNKILEIIKNGFSIARTEDGEIQFSVDNVYPLLKALGLNPQNESVMDMVREACMESSGGIEPSHFDEVVLSLVKLQDRILWGERLMEKKREALKESSEKAKADAEKMKKRMEQGVTEDEDLDDETWEEMDRKAIQKAKEKELEKQQDELYDNLKMAFRFIDSDEDGVISVKDVYNLMMGLGEMLDDDELYGMVTMADLDCDGKLTFHDFKKFLLRGTAEEVKSDSEEEDGNNALKLPKPKNQNSDPADDEAATADTSNRITDEAEPSNKKTADSKSEETSTKMHVEEPKVDESAKAKRKQSLLWGYTKPTPTKSAGDAEKQKDNDKVQSETENQSIKEVKEPVEPNDQSDKEETSDGTNLLNAIREEDEHSNYDMTEAAPHNTRKEPRTSATADGKRKHISRQSSAASLRNRPNSIIANSESTVDDSGFETLDTNIDCSEIREVPDVFDLSNDEMELQRLKSPRNASSGKGSKSRDAGESDEDKIDDECVRESLSRFSSLSAEGSLDSADEKEHVADSKLPPIKSTNNFVNAYMYVEVDRMPTEEDLMENLKSTVRLTRAEKLQKAILKRSNTEPAIIRYVPKSPTTPRTNINGVKCSHIDIDLSCKMPPKADIKSLRQFSDRVQSARTRTRHAVFDGAVLERKMSVVDMTQLVSDKALTSDGETSKWTPRPPTRPKSSRSHRHTMHAWEREVQTARPLRSQSAAPRINRREGSESPVPRERNLPRPMTANLTYSTPRRTVPDVGCAKLEKKGDFTVVTSDPFTKSDQLYPRKSLLTSYHHGFKSIWPIGRSINVLQNKRPFDSFEMNSYSRAVERDEFPFQGETSLENKENDEKISQRAAKTIKLELDMETCIRPKLKKLPVLLPCHFTPRSVR